MIVLDLSNPHWIGEEAKYPDDHCAHGYIDFRVNRTVFVDVAGSDWTVSAAGLYLLRTISNDHTLDFPVAESNLLIPCCGFSVWEVDTTTYPVLIVGCPNGIDPSITHDDGEVHIVLGDLSETVSAREWIEAVLRFTDQVQSFYDTSEPKNYIADEEDRRGWEVFWKEWSDRRAEAREALSGNA